MNINTDYYINIYFSSASMAYVALIPDLPECKARADSPEEAVHKVIAIKKKWLVSALEAGDSIPAPNFRPTAPLFFPL